MCASLHEEWDATKHMGFVPFQRARRCSLDTLEGNVSEV